MNTYHKQATDFLKKHEIGYKAVFVGITKPEWDDAKTPVNTFAILLTRINGGLKTYKSWFYGSIQDTREEKRTMPAYDFLAAITKSDPGTKWDFLNEYGYDATEANEKTYFAVLEEWQNVSGFFTEEEITELQEIC